ncbi:MAG: Gfo/Idh/MocA family oxidoreductase [Hamadaea sp.]|nr:Gfo/Idh/MocA family oxidoreductase [Hamadaea sp.]
MKPKVALIGAAGHGLSHRKHLTALAEAGELDFVALCDTAPIEDAGRLPVFTDHRQMLEHKRPDVVVICTPPFTHEPIAVDCVRAGADLLLEKPPVLSLAEHATLAAVLAEQGRFCQVGFQALGSPALPLIRRAVADGVLGEVVGVSAYGAWQRADSYWSRSPWAGRRSVHGRPSVDGALANPFAHAVMQCLALLPGGPPAEFAIELERFRARDIEVDDTSCVRIVPRHGPAVVVAVTLCAEGFTPGQVLVHGTEGRVELEYPTDRLRLPGEAGFTQLGGREDLLLNLLAHRRDPGVALLAPLALTAPFTAVVEAVQAAADPWPVDPARLSIRGEGPSRTVVVQGVDAVVRAAAERLALFSELSGLDGVETLRAPKGAA